SRIILPPSKSSTIVWSRITTFCLLPSIIMVRLSDVVLVPLLVTISWVNTTPARSGLPMALSESAIRVANAIFIFEIPHLLRRTRYRALGFQWSFGSGTGAAGFAKAIDSERGEAKQNPDQFLDAP